MEDIAILLQILNGYYIGGKDLKRAKELINILKKGIGE